jgi:hypothetical protein
MPDAQTLWSGVPMPWSAFGKTATAMAYSAFAAQDLTMGLERYSRDFFRCFVNASAIFSGVEASRLPFRPPLESIEAHSRLFETNLGLGHRGLVEILRSARALGLGETERALAAWRRTLSGEPGETIDAYAARSARVARCLVDDYPAAVEAVAEDYGFHFERGQNPLVLETDRFFLYRIVPTDSTVATDQGAKPLLILPPYVLGSGILAFLPGERRSYAHAFANQGVPTYIRIQKPIATTEAVQIMTPEEDCDDTRSMCETLMKAHGRPVTLNGYCQGGYTALINLLSGELDGLVDAMITCVSPMDGTRSDGLAGFLAALPPEFNDLAYGTKVLPSGNRVADGDLMGWIYKLKSIEQENPLSVFCRDLGAFASKDGPGTISKSAAGITYWLATSRQDLPLPITRVSYASYLEPISRDGTLPVKLFGRKLELPRLAAKGIRWLICYGERDDLVEKDVALAPTEHVRAEVTEFPRGHVAIATSWSHPESECALHTVFGKGYRGPVRYQLDLDALGRQREASASRPATGGTRKKAAPTDASPSKPARPATRRSKASKP